VIAGARLFVEGQRVSSSDVLHGRLPRLQHEEEGVGARGHGPCCCHISTSPTGLWRAHILEDKFLSWNIPKGRIERRATPHQPTLLIHSALLEKTSPLRDCRHYCSRCSRNPDRAPRPCSPSMIIINRPSRSARDHINRILQRQWASILSKTCESHVDGFFQDCRR
jgi:hypothetical protein